MNNNENNMDKINNYSSPALTSLSIIKHSMMTANKIIAPITPYLSEELRTHLPPSISEVNGKLTEKRSIFAEDYPQCSEVSNFEAVIEKSR